MRFKQRGQIIIVLAVILLISTSGFTAEEVKISEAIDIVLKSNTNLEITKLELDNAQLEYQQNKADNLAAQAESSDVASDAVDQIEYFLTKYTGGEDEFRIMSQDQILDTITNVTDSLSLMLVRKALGAKKKNILTQFLIESLGLSGLGGLLGVGIGYLSGYLISQVGSWPFVVSLSSVIIAFSFLLLIGLFSGIYPALKAANLEPIDALSYE